jgi:predicted RNase H-like HicB family nuclease
MSEPCRYSMLIRWSEEDGVYVLTLPELARFTLGNPVTHGETYEEAARNGLEALRALVGSLEDDGFRLPEPDVYTADEPARV